MNRKIKIIISYLPILVILLYFYTFLHECGHALIGIICGGKIDRFVLGFNAHISMSGASYTMFTEALMLLMGVSLPIIFLVIALIFYKPKIKNNYYHIIYGYLSLMITNSLLAWIIIPLISLFTLPPAGDDATRFLSITGLHPLIVMMTSLLLIILLVFLIYKRGLIRKIKEINNELLKGEHFKINKVNLIRGFIGILLGVVILAVVSNILAPKPVVETSFSMEFKDLAEDYNLPFSIDKNKDYKMNLKLKSKGVFTDIKIYTDNGTKIYQNLSDEFKLNCILQLKEGNYVLTLTFLQDYADMQEYFKLMGYEFEDNKMEEFKKIYSENNIIEKYSVSCSVTIK